MSGWQPDGSVAAARNRAAMLGRVRDYFDEQDVLEVDLPALSAYTTSDLNIDSIALNLGGETAYLQTSPESAMKCLLAAGYPDIFSISRVYRGSEKGRKHLTEFTMLEWYRRDYDLPRIVADTVGLIARCLERPEFTANVKTWDYQALVRDKTGIDIFTTHAAELADACSADARLRASLGEDRDAWLDLLLATRVAPGLPGDRLTVLQHYPASQAALARLCPADPRVADRFEVFLGPLELANGYVELRNAAEQRARFEATARDREAAGKPTVAADEFLLKALARGLPACAGVAAGFERLHMIYDEADSIDKVVTFADRTQPLETTDG